MSHRTATRRTFIQVTGAAALVGLGRLTRLDAEPIQAPEVTAEPSSRLAGSEAIFRPTSKGCTVHWVPTGPIEARVSAGSAPDLLAIRKEVASSDPTQVVVDGFAPDSEFYLQTAFRRPGAQEWVHQPVRCLHTARRPGSEFRLALIADSHVYYAIRSRQHMRNLGRTIEQVLEDRPDFVIFLGDEGGVAAHRFDQPGFMNQRRAIQRWAGWRTAFAPLLAAVPAYLVLGNHEGEAGYYQSHSFGGVVHHYQRWGTIARKRVCLNPLPGTYPEGGENQAWVGNPQLEATAGASEGNCSPLQNYYAWTWGNALFVVLDVHRYTNVGGSEPNAVEQWTLGPIQMKWLDAVLTASRARWKFVVAHHLVGGSAWDRFGVTRRTNYVFGRGGARYARVGEQARITEIMNRSGTQFFLYGHDHVFAHQRAEDIHFVCCGRPTWLSSAWWRNPGWKEAYGEADARNPNDFYGAIGYTRLTISADRTLFEYIRTGTDAGRAENVPTREGEVVHALSVV